MDISYDLPRVSRFLSARHLQTKRLFADDNCIQYALPDLSSIEYIISIMIYTFWNTVLVDGYLNSIQTKLRLSFLPQNLPTNYLKYFFSTVS